MSVIEIELQRQEYKRAHCAANKGLHIGLRQERVTCKHAELILYPQTLIYSLKSF